MVINFRQIIFISCYQCIYADLKKSVVGTDPAKPLCVGHKTMCIIQIPVFIQRHFFHYTVFIDIKTLPIRSNQQIIAMFPQRSYFGRQPRYSYSIQCCSFFRVEQNKLFSCYGEYSGLPLNSIIRVERIP